MGSLINNQNYLGYLYIHTAITIPLAVILTFPMNWGLNGILFANICGNAILAIFFAINCFMTNFYEQ